MSEKAYDPRSAFLGMKAGLKTLQQQQERARPALGLVDQSGTALVPSVTSGPATCCVLLLAFLNRHPMVPDDFHNVERTLDGIQSYVRPDGAVYLGSFELPKEPGSVVLVYGDPALSQERAVAASLAYRRKLHEEYETAMALRMEEIAPRSQELSQ